MGLSWPWLRLGVLGVSPTPLGVPDSAPALQTESRRITHISAEQKRRFNIKLGFDTLHGLVSTLSAQPSIKVSERGANPKVGTEGRTGSSPGDTQSPKYQTSPNRGAPAPRESPQSWEWECQAQAASVIQLCPGQAALVCPCSSRPPANRSPQPLSPAIDCPLALLSWNGAFCAVQPPRSRRPCRGGWARPCLPKTLKGPAPCWAAPSSWEAEQWEGAERQPQEISITQPPHLAPQVSKATTLQKTAEYIYKLQQERAALQDETQRLREQIEELNTTIK